MCIVDKLKLKKGLITLIQNSVLENKETLEDGLNGTSKEHKEINLYIAKNNLEDKWVLLGKTIINHKIWKEISNKNHFFKDNKNFFKVNNLGGFEIFKGSLEEKSEIDKKVIIISNENTEHEEKIKNIVILCPSLDNDEFLNIVREFLDAKKKNENLKMAETIFLIDDWVVKNKGIITTSKAKIDNELSLSKDKKTRLKERKNIFDKVKGNNSLERILHEISDNKIKKLYKIKNIEELKSKLKLGE